MSNSPRLLRLLALVTAALMQACSPDDAVAPPPTPQYGQIRLIVSTEGVDVNPQGHEVLIEPLGQNGPVPEYHSIPPNGTWTIRLRAPVTYLVSFGLLSPNCTPVEAETWQVTVAPDQATDVTVNVSCTRFEGILVSESGPGLPALGLVYADGSGFRDLGEGGAPTWSPNGEFMAFVSQGCGYNPEEFTCNPTLSLSTLHNARSGIGVFGTNGSFPAWHPGGFIAYLEGKRLHRVTLGAPPVSDLIAELPVDSAADLEWSSDGSRLAFTCVLNKPLFGEGEVRSDICLVHADGSNFQVLTHEPDSHAQPAWHPDGRIAFTTTRFGEVSIATMRSDGSGIARLTAGSDPAWSPDGTRLAVVRGGAAPGLFVMNQDGSEERLLASGQFAAPAWRPTP
jgi:hypothetical protein